MNNTYNVSKQKGSSRWYAHLTETPKVPASRLADKKTALHDAADLMGLSYKEYMDWRRQAGKARPSPKRLEAADGRRKGCA